MSARVLFTNEDSCELLRTFLNDGTATAARIAATANVTIISTSVTPADRGELPTQSRVILRGFPPGGVAS